MSYSFEYIDIILLAMIAGFIFLRLRGILGKKTGFEGKIPTQFEKKFQKTNIALKPINNNLMLLCFFNKILKVIMSLLMPFSLFNLPT